MRSNPKAILEKLKQQYPKPAVFLKHANPLELLVATILSAQCTDAQVNRITKKLFQKYRKLEDYVNANPRTFEKEIKSTGFFRQKTKNILAAAKKIKKEFNGKVPNTMNKLLTLPGVGRKTANIVLSRGFGKNEGIAVDTHVKRLSLRLGLSKNTIPEKIETDLMKLALPGEYAWLSSALILHGRKTCRARNPACVHCFLNKACPSAFTFSPTNQTHKFLRIQQ
ncbi:MAG: endonuclease III [Candidatus Micrarchaeota archaeon]